MPEMIDTLKNEKYISLETYKKDGNPVRLPVWLAELDGKLVFWTDGESFKVKRIRRNPNARIAACNASGKAIRGDWFDATAEVLENAESVKRVNAAIAKRYGWQKTFIDLLSKVRGASNRGVGIALSPRKVA